MRILIVEDDETFRERLGRALRERGHDAVTAGDGAAARSLARDGFDVAIVDVRLGPESGLDLLRDLVASQPSGRIVVVTGNMSHELPGEAARLGATACLAKPFDVDDLMATLKGTEAGSR